MLFVLMSTRGSNIWGFVGKILEIIWKIAMWVSKKCIYLYDMVNNTLVQKHVYLLIIAKQMHMNMRI